MSWNGTLTCSYCYERGHSKRKCPEMKKQHDEYVALTEAGETPSWRQRSARREYKAQRETLKESNKVCSYCNEHGHRVLTCPMRLGDVKKLQKINKWWKPLALKTLRGIGLGKGALITRNKWIMVDGNHEKRDVPHLVLGFDTQNHRGALDFTGFAEGFGNLLVMDTTDMRQENVYLPAVAHNALFHAAFEIEGYSFGENRWHEETKAHPLQSKVPRGLGRGTIDPVLAPSDSPLGDQDALFFPLKAKREINKMFRASKRGSEYFTGESSGCFIRHIYPLLKEHKGVK
jgi:hypothetical protein